MKLTYQIPAAFIVGLLYYMLAVMVTVYDGALSLISQPILGSFFTCLGIVLCLLIGLPIRLSKRIGQYWSKNWWLAIVIGVLGFVLMMISNSKEFQIEVFDPYLATEVDTLNPVFALTGWLITIFAVLHFDPPIFRKANQAGEAIGIRRSAPHTDSSL